MVIEIQGLLWDEGRIAHIARHGVTPSQVEEVSQGDFVAYAGRDGTIIILGPTAAGRILKIVLAPREQAMYYPVTAHPASRQERRHYNEQKGGEKAA